MNQNLIQKKQPPGNALQLQLLISCSDIQSRLEKTAHTLETEYKDQEVTIVMVMKGAFILVGDLMRHLHLPISLETIQAASYGEGGMVKGDVKLIGVDALDIAGKHVLVVDDIFDTGETLDEIIKALKGKKPKSLRSLVLLSKDVPRSIDYRPDLSLFEIEDRFVVGYGLDYKEYYRGLPDIYSIER